MMFDRPTKRRISLVHTLDYKERMEDSHVNRQLCDCVEDDNTYGRYTRAGVVLEEAQDSPQRLPSVIAALSTRD